MEPGIVAADLGAQGIFKKRMRVYLRGGDDVAECSLWIGVVDPF